MKLVPTWVQFALLATVWGASFLCMKVGLEGLSPGQVALVRLVTGAVTLLVICAVTRTPLPFRRGVWPHLLVVGVFLCVIPFLLFAWAEQHISSGLASIYNATTPLMTLGIAMLALPSEPRTRERIVGLFLGFVGVVLLLAPWQGVGAAGAWGQVACLAATFCYGIGFTYLRRSVSPMGLPAISAATGQVTLAALLMLALCPVVARGPVDVTPRVILAMLLLGALGTGLAYVWNTNVVHAWGATNASTVTYLTPVVGVLLGVLLLGEHLTWNEPVGAAVVVLGIAAGQGRLTRR